MTDVNLAVLPQVTIFVQQVRARLGDLDPEVRDELTDGLEADLSELVAEHGGSGPLGEVSPGASAPELIDLAEIVGTPTAYADELRAAAGLPAHQPTVGTPRRLWGEILDGWRDRVLTLMERPAFQGIWHAAVGMRPLWWILRAWAACLLIDEIVLTPWIRGVSFLPTTNAALGLLMVIGASVLSVQIGRRRVWPGTGQSSARTILGLLNVFAVIVTPIVFTSALNIHDIKVQEPMWEYDRFPSNGLEFNGGQVCNITPYDAAGQPLSGVQLFDQDGQPLNALCDGNGDGFAPWMLGDVQRWNVFPQGWRGDGATADMPSPEPSVVPGVTSPAPPSPSTR